MPNLTPAIMIQGTCSNAGKSLLVAALCRIFAQDGYNPAPFKAQNMALNSFVTAENCEIGRAQALQAVACHRAPHVLMNPVLLKPHSDIGSQVIIMGKPIKHMPVKEYIAYKPKAWQSVTKAYDTLSQDADIMVIEGAGSPAEINLKSHDIVNMTMAQYAKSKVLLCTDIDRGGAFAALVGTMALLDKDEQASVAGFILNKFRGDASLLSPALEDISKRTQKPFVGIVPWIKDLNLPEEDSVSFRLYTQDHTPKQSSTTAKCLDVALIDLPHISNITDIDALRVEPDVNLRIVRNAKELGQPDMLIIPGTKNTPADLQYLYQSGIAEKIMAQAKEISCILGICGGLQILGQSIADPDNIESTNYQKHIGLGLLPLHTELKPKKTLRQCKARYKNQLPIEGYEIHHGYTFLDDSNQNSKNNTTLHPVILDETNPNLVLGWELNNNTNRILGTYIHGVLDSDEFRRNILDDIYVQKNMPPRGKTTSYALGPSLDALANTVRNHIDLDFIYRLLELKK